MSTDPRDALWEATFRVYYDVYYSEIVANKLIAKWQITDDITKVLVAVTASTSAVAGWALWQQPEFKIIWTVIAGLSAFLALTHAALSVPRRLKDWVETESHFLSLRITLMGSNSLMGSGLTIDIHSLLPCSAVNSIHRNKGVFHFAIIKLKTTTGSSELVAPISKSVIGGSKFEHACDYAKLIAPTRNKGKQRGLSFCNH